MKISLYFICNLIALQSENMLCLTSIFLSDLYLLGLLYNLGCDQFLHVLCVHYLSANKYTHIRAYIYIHICICIYEINHNCILILYSCYLFLLDQFLSKGYEYWPLWSWIHFSPCNSVSLGFKYFKSMLLGT